MFRTFYTVFSPFVARTHTEIYIYTVYKIHICVHCNHLPEIQQAFIQSPSFATAVVNRLSCHSFSGGWPRREGGGDVSDGGL